MSEGIYLPGTGVSLMSSTGQTHTSTAASFCGVYNGVCPQCYSLCLT